MRILKSAFLVSALIMVQVAFIGPAAADEAACRRASTMTLVPIERESAMYPAAAHADGIEGFVFIVFDVTAEGAVENVIVVDQNPPGVFDRGVVAASHYWRFEPPMDEEGNAIRVCGKRQRIDFQLDG